MRATRKAAAQAWLARAAALRLEVWADRHDWTLWARCRGAAPPDGFLQSSGPLKSDIIALLTADTDEESQ